MYEYCSIPKETKIYLILAGEDKFTHLQKRVPASAHRPTSTCTLAYIHGWTLCTFEMMALAVAAALVLQTDGRESQGVKRWALFSRELETKRPRAVAAPSFCSFSQVPGHAEFRTPIKSPLAPGTGEERRTACVDGARLSSGINQLIKQQITRR